MGMKAITMSLEQTRIYDDGDAREADALMRELRQQARELHAQTGETVEIYTVDGVVVAAVCGGLGYEEVV